MFEDVEKASEDSALINLISALVLCVSVPTPKELPDVDIIADAMTEMRPRLSLDDAKIVAGAALEAGVAHKVDPLFLLGVAFVESRWTIHIKPGDNNNSFGLYQMSYGAAKRVNFAGIFEDEDEYCGTKMERKQMRWVLEEPFNASFVAAAYIAHLRRKYGKRKGVYDVMVIYNCGPSRCKQSDGTQRRKTPATRGYWGAYRRLKRIVKKIENMHCEPGKPGGYGEKDA